MMRRYERSSGALDPHLADLPISHSSSIAAGSCDQTMERLL